MPIVELLLHAVKSNPEIAIFLAIALGTLIGRVHIGSFHLGTVAGSLLMGIIIGQIGVNVPPILKSIFFALFIYSIGFKSGPGFFGSLNRGTFKLVIFSVVLCVTGLGVILLMNHWLGLDAGFSAGLGAGALTDTAMMGTASSAINGLNISTQDAADLNSHMAIAYAITYLFGTVGLIVFVSDIAPWLLKVNLKESARELELELSDGQLVSSSEFTSPYRRIVARAHQVNANSQASGLQIRQLEERTKFLTIERIIRGDQIMDREESLVLQTGDIVGIAARRDSIGNLNELVGPEVDNQLALSYPTKVVDVVLNKPELHNKTLAEIREILGPSATHGLFLNQIMRQGYLLPLLPNTQYQRGDVARISGRPEAVDALAMQFGHVKKDSHKSDLALHTFGIVLGSLVGLLSVHIGNVPIELGVGGGILIVALIFGWLQSRHPSFGDLPPAAQWAFSEFGLTAFAAVIGLLAGPKAIHAIQEHGLSLLLAGVAVTLIPPIVAFYFGRYVLKLHPMILLGGLAGAQTEAASMNSILEKSQSQTPVIGFTVCYAVSNVLFAVWGPIIVAFIKT